MVLTAVLKDFAAPNGLPFLYRSLYLFPCWFIRRVRVVPCKLQFLREFQQPASKPAHPAHPRLLEHDSHHPRIYRKSHHLPQTRPREPVNYERQSARSQPRRHRTQTIPDLVSPLRKHRASFLLGKSPGIKRSKTSVYEQNLDSPVFSFGAYPKG